MVFYRRRLPHWQPQEKALFITWCLCGSLPATCCPQHRKQAAATNHKVLRHAPASRQARGKFLCLGQSAGFRKVRTALAEGPGRGQACREGPARGRKQAVQLYHLHAYAVMPNHVHILARPGASLERISRALKGFTARQANKILGRTGQRLWQQESYDHWVRSEESFSRIAEYVEHNPVRAGLAKRAEDWPWSSAHS